MAARSNSHLKVHRILLGCGLLSSIWYLFMNIYVPAQDPTYAWTSQTISELSAFNAPTRDLWVGMGWIYSLLLLAFGIGLWGNGMRWAGGAVVLQAAINPFWPPMHLRPVLAAGGGTVSDQLHIAFTLIWAVLSRFTIGFGAASQSRGFRLYSWVTVALLLGFGTLTGQGAPRMEANLSTPLIGLWERICSGSYMLWIAVLTLALLRRSRLET